MLLELIPLFIILALAIISKNMTTYIAIFILIFIRIFLEERWNILTIIENKFLLLGIIFLTMAVLAPLAKGKIGLPEIISSFKHPSTLIAVFMGIFVSWTASKGVPLMAKSPEIVTALAIGTILGICLFKGLAVGPLISAGLVALVLGFI